MVAVMAQRNDHYDRTIKIINGHFNNWIMFGISPKPYTNILIHESYKIKSMLNISVENGTFCNCKSI